MSETIPKASIWRRFIPLLVMSVAGVAAYSNSFGVPFVFDDLRRIVEDPAIRTAWPPSVIMAETNRPFAFYTFALNYAVHGYQLWGYHATNLAIHIAAGLLLFGIIRRTLLRGEGELRENADGLALIASLIWLLHPLQTQAVTYTVQRLESLMGLSYLATLYCFIRARESRRPIAWQIASISACAFGMGCKEVMASAPLIVLWYDRAFIAVSWRELVSRRKYYYAALALTWGVLAWAMLHFTGEYTGGALVSVKGLTPWTYLVSQAGVLVHYLRLCFWPSGQNLDYLWPIADSVVDVLPQALLIVSLLGLTVWSIFRRPKWSFLGGWFFLILAPTSSVMPIQDLAFEHRMYLPLAAVTVMAVLGGAWLLQRVAAKSPDDKTWQRLSASLAFGVIVALGIMSYQRNGVYATTTSLWSDVVEKAPWNSRAWNNLGRGWKDAGDRERALSCLELAVKLDAHNAEALANLAAMKIDEQDYASALALLRRAIEEDPTLIAAHLNLAHALGDCGQYAEAAEHYRTVLQERPDEREVLVSLAGVLVPLGQADEAERLCREVLQREPQRVKAHLNLGFALLAQGKPAEAMTHFQRAAELDPGSAEAHAGMAQILAATNRAAALDEMSAALRLAPTSPSVNLGMGNLIAPTQPAEAIRYFEAALQYRPEYPEALFNLANAWVACGYPEKAIPYLKTVVKLVPDWQQARINLRLLEESMTQTESPATQGPSRP